MIHNQFITFLICHSCFKQIYDIFRGVNIQDTSGSKGHTKVTEKDNVSIF